MIGAGGLGCPVLQYLAAAGTGEIGIIDHDVVDESNLHRQILYSNSDVGKKKASVAKAKLLALNPFVAVNDYPERLTVKNAPSLFSIYDLIIDGSDNFPTRYLVNDICMELKKPLVFGSIFKFEGQVSVFNYQDGPSYRDIFPDPPAEGEVPNCAEIGVIGVLPGIIGLYMVNEAIKIICGIGETLSGKLMSINALDNSINIFKVEKANSIGKNAPKNTVKSSPDVSEINMDKLDAWLAQSPDEVCLIDVREEHEFEAYNIGGQNIPLSDIADEVKKFPLNKKLVFCCQSGQRSKMAVNLARDIYTGELYSLKNGLF